MLRRLRKMGTDPGRFVPRLLVAPGRGQVRLRTSLGGFRCPDRSPSREPIATRRSDPAEQPPARTPRRSMSAPRAGGDTRCASRRAGSTFSGKPGPQTKPHSRGPCPMAVGRRTVWSRLHRRYPAMRFGIRTLRPGRSQARSDETSSPFLLRASLVSHQTESTKTHGGPLLDLDVAWRPIAWLPREPSP